MIGGAVCEWEEGLLSLTGRRWEFTELQDLED